MVAGYIAYMREKLPDRLANYPRFYTLFNSSLSGFSFCAELLLLMAFFAEKYTGLGVVMLLGRLIHVVGGLVIGVALFGYGKRLEERAGCVLDGLSHVRDTMDQQYLEENIYMAEMTMLCALCDTTMLQFMPYKKSRFYSISEGWPTLKVMKICLAVKTVQTVMSVACELAYVSQEAQRFMSMESSALLYLNIILNVFAVVYALVMLLMRQGILRCI